MRTETEVGDKWLEVSRNLRGEGPVATQSETNTLWMRAQKELLEWVLS